MPTTQPLLSTQEVARRWGVSRETVNRFISAGTLPACLVGGQWRIDAADVAAFGKRNVALINSPLAPTPERGVLLTYAETATYLRVGKRTVEQLVADGVLPSVKIGKIRRFHQDDLDAYLREARA